MKYYARGDTDHGKLAQKNYEKMKNNTYAKGGKALPIPTLPPFFM